MKSFRDLLESKKIPDANKNGDCFVVSFRYQQTHPKVTLVHGLVSGQGPLEGIVYNHAWCEDGNTIIDMTQPPKAQKSIPMALYYAIGNIKTTYKYNINQTSEKIKEFGTYGPWEKKLMDNKY